MKKVITLVFAFACFATAIYATNVKKSTQTSKNSLTIIENQNTHFTAVNTLSDYHFVEVNTPRGNFSQLACSGYSMGNSYGRPSLPVKVELIEIPFGAKPQINIISYDIETIQLSSLGIQTNLIPAQPSVSKNTPTADVVFQYDETYYNTDAFNENALVSIENVGVARGVQMGSVSIAPFRYNPALRILKVYKNIKFEVNFVDADLATTEQNKHNFYSVYFEPVYHSMINYIPSQQKDVISKYPIKYVIVSDPMFQGSLQTFIQWKRRKGFTVIEAYTNNAAVGTTTASIKTYLTGLYTAGTASNPAPTFVLFVGDVAQIPTFAGTSSGTHVTDLYYTTFDGAADNIPDMYFGRFSATNPDMLTPQIDKTLEYEQYTMPSKTYLDTVVMIAGVDVTGATGGYSPVHANGQINYGTSNYFNTAHSIESRTYLWPLTDNSATDALIRADIGRGVAYANYTAHCSSSGWADPSFLTSNISAMNNAHKYGLLVGNCCQSNKFEEAECFGESMLRTANKGAVGYIGGSDYSYWDEDYYWGVGSRASIVANPTYDAANLGGYDRMFHDQGIPKTEWFYTNYQMIYAGNLAVQQSTSSLKKYYWEMYQLMGDPSVMTYFGMPNALTATYNNPVLVGTSTLSVTTQPYAYVAISMHNNLLDAKMSDSLGVALLSFPAFTSIDTADVVVTKQNYAPYIGVLDIFNVSVPLDAQISSIASPGAAYNCTGINVTPKVVLRNMGLNTLTTATVQYKMDNQAISTYNWNGSIASYNNDTISLPAITLQAGSHTYYTKVQSPNGGIDGNPTNDSLIKSFIVTQLPLVSNFVTQDTGFCQQPADVHFTNLSQNALDYSWDFGDGTTSTDANPIHTYTSLGNFVVTLTSSAGICGTQTFSMQGSINVGSTVPSVLSDTSCIASSLTLTANGNGTLNWYDAPIAGNLIYTGNTFVTPIISNSVTYYIENLIASQIQNVGELNNTTNGSMYTSSAVQYLKFDCYAPMTLKSVLVNASTAGSRVISLRNSAGTVLQSATVTIPVGVSRVTLNFTVSPGVDLQLAGPLTPNLYRTNSTSLTYPYVISNLVSITTSGASSNPNNYYYYFYDWEVKAADCQSARVPVSGVIAQTPVAAFSFTSNSLAVTFSNASSGTPMYSWDFGDGSFSTLANPIHTYSQSGTYMVTLSVYNKCGNSSISKEVTVAGAGIDESSLSGVSIYPNPTDGLIYINTQNFPAKKIQICDVLGRIILERAISTARITTIDLSQQEGGICFVRIFSNDNVITKRVIIKK